MNEFLPESITNSIISNKDFYFVQIGAHDGETIDPICEYIKEYDWSGIMVEPYSLAFERLEKKYKDNPKISLEKKAISNFSGQTKLYLFDMPIKPGMVSLANSIIRYSDADNYRKCSFFKEEKFEMVDVITLNELLKKYNKKFINFLVMDTEGSDLDILRSIDFEEIEIESILFEKWRHQTIDMNNPRKSLYYKDNFDVINKLKNLGYKIWEFESDFFATKLK